MAKFLFVWELGNGYGHITRILPVALELQKRGHSVEILARDVMLSHSFLNPYGIKSFQAPIWRKQTPNFPDSISYPEMLRKFGYADSESLTHLCITWRETISALSPDVIIMDHAPTALLATRGMSFKRVNLGDGFCIPPDLTPIPPFCWWEPIDSNRLITSEKFVLGIVNKVLTALNSPLMQNISELHECDETLLCSFPELDQYPGRATSKYVGPILPINNSAHTAWPRNGKTRVFAYLRSTYAELDKVLELLRGSDISSLVHIAGASDKLMETYNSDNLTISAEQLNIDQMVNECNVVVCHGGAGTTSAALLAGKPLNLLPMQMEQTMLSYKLAKFGMASAMSPAALEKHSHVFVNEIIDHSRLKNPMRFAEVHKLFNRDTVIKNIVDSCESLLSTV